MARVWAILVAVATATFVLAPLATPGFGGFDMEAFTVPQLDPPILPAGYAFGIWGLIYTLLIISSVFGLWYRADDMDWGPMRPALFVSLALGTVWLVVAKASPVAATGLLGLMLATGLLALFRTGETDRWLQLTPLAIYCGWLTAAFAVAVGLLLGGELGLNPTVAALCALGGGLVLAIAVQYQLHRAPEYSLAVIWALVAVIAANWQPFNVAVCGIAFLGIIAILGLRGTDTE
ncbi:MAG: hypothetical protein P8Q92_09715 [Pseudoprimorskyibacter sp.]|nr:hypothetical protein [Pseudoprimorskyibacter sp.]